MSIYEEEDFTNREDVELDEDEQTGLVIVPGQLIFEDAYKPSNGGNEEYDERYGVTWRLPKGNEFAAKLFAVCDVIGEKTWKGEFEEKMEAVWDCVDKGVNPKNSNINIQDGDLHNPEYNRGQWQIKASRRFDEGPPEILLSDGTAVEWDPEKKSTIDAAKKVGPKRGDYCYFMIRVWCQKKRERINFTLEGIQLAERGTLRVQKADRKQIQTKFGKVKGLSMGFAPKQIASGRDEDEVDEIEDEDEEAIEAEVVQPAKKSGAKPAAKVVAKSKPVAKKGIFRGKKK